MMNTFCTLIANVGFPIAITIYLLVVQSKVIQKNTQATTELTIYLKSKGK